MHICVTHGCAQASGTEPSSLNMSKTECVSVCVCVRVLGSGGGGNRRLLGATVAAGLHSLSQDSLVAVPCLPGAEICFSATETLFLVFLNAVTPQSPCLLVGLAGI